MKVRPDLFQRLAMREGLPAVLAWILVGMVGLPAVWNSHWMWIDDQMVVGQQLWPPDSPTNQAWHAAGREFIAHGLYFKLLSLVFPLRPFWYYLANYLMHLAVLGLVGWIVWRVAQSWRASTLAILTAGFASTGPEVFLTLMKQELPMMLWLLISLLLVQRLLRPDLRCGPGSLLALTATTFLSGTLGKETFVILPVGLVTAVIAAALAGTGLPILRRLLATCGASLLGVVAVFVERRLLGVYSIAKGSYTAKLLVLNPSLAASLDRANIYAYQAGDALLLTALVAILSLGCIIVAASRRSGLSVARIVTVFCAAAASSQVAFNIMLLDYVQVYYLYPAAILAAVGLACLWPGHGGERPRLRCIGRIGLATVLVTTTILTLPTFFLRLYAQNAIPATEWPLIRAIAATPSNSLVLLAFPPELELIRNTPVLARYALGRRDLDVESALEPGVAARVNAAQMAGRPVFLAFVYDFGDNWEVGVRGVAQMTRAKTLALLARHGIPTVCHDQSETLGPWPITVSRVMLAWPPILHFQFGYGWELDRVPTSVGCP